MMSYRAISDKPTHYQAKWPTDCV